jgi:murein hydrolase activator
MTAALLLGLAALPALAQSPTDNARKMLDAGKRALSDNDKRQGELQAELARLKEDEAQIRAQQLQVAKHIQASEAQLSAIEQRRGELEAQEVHVRGSLVSKQGSLSGLLAAMQRMGRNPPPVMITRREDALDMVRSAKLIAASAPELAAQANALADQLTDLSRIMTSIKAEEDKLRDEKRQMSEAQTRLASLTELRKQTLSDRTREASDLKRATNEIKREVADLGEFIAKADREISERTRLGQYEKELAASAAREAAERAAQAVAVAPVATAPAAAVPPKTVATVEIKPEFIPPEKPVAAAPPAPQPKAVAAAPAPAPKPDLKPSIILAPNDRMAMAAPGRIQPAMPFADAKGRLPMPAQGRRVVNYGEKTQRGSFQGIAIETRFGAQVTSPTDGWVVYAGEFRSYGQILIINAGGGYHILLANMSQIDAAQGQFVLAGEPVGTMAPAPKGAPAPARGQAQEGAPILYIEFKKDQKSIDPDPWWAEPPKKNAGLITPNVNSPQFPPG